MFSKSSFGPAAAAALFLLANTVNADGRYIQDLNRTTLYPDGLGGLVDPGFLKYLKPTPSYADQWGHGWIPKDCFDMVEGETVDRKKLSASDVQVFNVKYTDCGPTWTFCRHHKADISQALMIDLFGRLPVHERQYIRHVVAVPGHGSAYESGGNVLFRGPVGHPSHFQHEVGHAVDAFRHENFTSSETDIFINAIFKDTCVPDPYSNSDNIEDWTQTSVLALFDIVVPGGLANLPKKPTCFRNQKRVVDMYQGDVMIPGGQCTRRWQDSEYVSMDSGLVDNSGSGSDTFGTEKRERINVISPKPLPNLKRGDPLAVRHQPKMHRSKDTFWPGAKINPEHHIAAVKRQEEWSTMGKRAQKFRV